MKIKQHLFLTVLLIAAGVYAKGQNNNVWSAFYYRVNVSAYAGMNFRMQAAVRSKPFEKRAHAALWARVDKKNGQMGFFYNMDDKPITTDKWKTYSIKGKIDDSARSLLIGGISQDNGIYCYDAFQLEIQNKEGQWIKQPLPNEGFEQESLDGMNFFGKKSDFSLNIKTGNAFEKNRYLEISATGIVHKASYGDNDSTGKYVKANGIEIYYEEYGSGEPLLLLHGNSQSIEAFKDQIPELAKSYHVIAVDTRGHGKSEDKGKKYTYELFAADMNALLDKLSIDSANIVGWSDGGNTGLIMAMKYPQKVKKLVTMGAVIFCDSTAVTKDVLNELRFGIEELKNAKTKEEKNNLKLMVLLRDEPNYKFSDLNKITCPVLVMAGEKDLVKIGHTQQIAANIPRAQLFIAPGQTHYFPEKDPAGFNKAVLDFLKK